MQEIRRFKPSTVSRRSSATAGFYRTCVIDGLLPHSPAEHVRRPAVPPNHPPSGSPTCSSRPCSPPLGNHPTCDFALVAMLGLLGLRIFEATGANIADLGEEHGHRVLRVCGKRSKVVQVPLPPAVGRALTGQPGPATTARSCSTAAAPGWTAMRQPAVCGAWPRPPGCGRRSTRTCSATTMLDAGVDLRDVQIAARHADPRTTMRYDRTRTNLDRHPNYILAAYMSSAT
jgi:integrase/recombinase XerD